MVRVEFEMYYAYNTDTNPSEVHYGSCGSVSFPSLLLAIYVLFQNIFETFKWGAPCRRVIHSHVSYLKWNWIVSDFPVWNPISLSGTNCFVNSVPLMYSLVRTAILQLDR